MLVPEPSQTIKVSVTKKYPAFMAIVATRLIGLSDLSFAARRLLSHPSRYCSPRYATWMSSVRRHPLVLQSLEGFVGAPDGAGFGRLTRTLA